MAYVEGALSDGKRASLAQVRFCIDRAYGIGRKEGAKSDALKDKAFDAMATYFDAPCGVESSIYYGAMNALQAYLESKQPQKGKGT